MKKKMSITWVKQNGSLPFCVAKNDGEGPEMAAATVEGLAFSNRP
jgi:hypothetical protein